MALVRDIEQQRDENTVNEQNQCSVTWRVPKLEAASEEEEDVSGGFSDVCFVCGGSIAFLDHHTEPFIKHTGEVCCHLCQMKFSQVDLLTFHLKDAHPLYHMLCKSCKTTKTQRWKSVDEDVEEVVIETEEVEEMYVKEEEEEEVVVVGRMEATEVNSKTETPEDNKMDSILHDHTYVSTQTCRETNNVVMYTSSDNVLVFVNKTDTKVFLKDSYTERDEPRASVEDQAVYASIHDHTYFSSQSPTNHMLLSKQESPHNTCSSFTKTENNVEHMHLFNNKADTKMSPKDRASPEDAQNHMWNHEDMLDHNYFCRQSLENHTVPSASLNTHKVNKEKFLNNQNHRNNVTESSQLIEYDIKVEDAPCDFEPILEDAVIGETEESDHEYSDTLSIDNSVDINQEDLNSETLSCISTDSDGDISEEDCRSINGSACPNPVCENSNQKPLSLDSVKSYPANVLYKDQQICTCCGLSKVPKPEKSMELCTCTQFPCPLCGTMCVTEEMLLNHQAEKHPLAKYICMNCLEIFPNQSTLLHHVYNKCSGESLTQSNRSSNVKRPLFMILNFMPSSDTAESFSRQRVNLINTAQNPGIVSTSTSHSITSNNLSISTTQNAPVQVIASRSSNCAQKKVDHGQMMTSISTVPQKQTGPVQVLCSLTPNVYSSSSKQILPSSQGQIQMTSTVTQTKSGQKQDLTPLQSKVVTHTPPASTEWTPGIVFPQQQPSQSTEILPSSQGPLKIVAMFVNQSKELALQKRMGQSWRTKTVFPCRQCGAMSRQFSLSVRHRYQHRGPRRHKCQCGRAFQQRMHLLRHQVAHAESTRYVCAACGQMFCGTQQLACHKPFFRVTAKERKKQANKACRNMFQCYCGCSFTRPAALLWHMLKNTKARKPRLKGCTLT